ncbi:Dabb family protein (plasmid) [Rhodococcus sp. USK10]|uniref:Dabb family protein n=1 Tax=Rhodococcus sp. USK10 TaxID=2789739 RepID=UPI001C6072DD|nr:Dabb family protein [Rhodococcus sp. USK10]QYB00174.1 Dabb family protein [Rhodococcus sp. USK10]
MIRHYFLWKTSDTEFSSAVLQQLTDLVAATGVSATAGEHEGVSPTGKEWSGAFTADFATKQDLDTFMGSPEHRTVVAQIAPSLDDVAIVDVEVGSH